MKKLFQTFIVLLVLGFSANTAKAQLGDVSQILQSGINDANILVEEYLKPFGNGSGAGLNTGWTNTAKTHSKFGFDITLSSGLAVVPGADKTFDVTQIGLQELELQNAGANPIAQTISGSDASGPTLASFDDVDSDGIQEELFNFDLPGGTGFGYVPAPELKAGLGLIKDTEIMLRYIPEFEVQDYGSFKQFGFGVKHGLNQWLPGGNRIPVDLSIMVGYTKQNVFSGFRITGEDVVGGRNNVKNPYTPQSSTWDGQKVDVDTKAFTANALVGKTLPFISVYGGIGLESSTVSISTPGSYPTVGANPNFQPSNPTAAEPLRVETLDEPIDIELDGSNSFHALAGFRIKLSVIHISGSYKLADYSTFNLGAGISFR
ncbi:hypothetical protein LX73_0346 [Fodinibius salinus]|uniref:Outer membrane protein beta-barrel domain-containing protein n=1 Tax=Fodinibius salinus TaxID=860790 RepID=A0A5D3YR75_9BACT|nr:DUF6588 family protein [Fodinibius salinus]TYP95051.1 hypothetical protein LX73_0346 [Fodinibius salinus]